MKNRRLITAGCVAALLLLGFGLVMDYHLDVSSNLYVPEIEQNARTSQNVPDSWESVSETTENVAAVLMYDGETNEHNFVVYSKSIDAQTDNSFSIIAGGAIPSNRFDIAELYSDDFDEYIYVSMNRQKACLLQITMDSKFSTVQIDPDKPFVIILSQRNGEITFYDKNDQLIQYDTFKL